MNLFLKLIKRCCWFLKDYSTVDTNDFKHLYILIVLRYIPADNSWYIIKYNHGMHGRKEKRDNRSALRW